MNPIDRLVPDRARARALFQHHWGECEPDCQFCRFGEGYGEGYTAEGLQIREYVIDVPGEGRRRVVQESSRTGEVLFEEKWAPMAEFEGAWTLVTDGFPFLARKLVELEYRWNELRGSQRVEPIQRAQVKRDRKAARQRLRRLAAERSSVIVELDDAEERRVIREVLAGNSPTPVSDDEIEPSDTVVWLSSWLDATEVARLTLERPVIVVGSVARGLWEVLHEAADAFRFSLYRFTVAGCRAVTDAAVETAMNRVNAWDRLAGYDDKGLKSRIDCLGELDPATRQDLHWLRKHGNDALHKAEKPVSEDLAREALIRTKSALERMTDAGVLGNSE